PPTTTHTPCTVLFLFSLIPPPPRSTLFPYTTLFRSVRSIACDVQRERLDRVRLEPVLPRRRHHQRLHQHPDRRHSDDARPGAGGALDRRLRVVRDHERQPPLPVQPRQSAVHGCARATRHVARPT